MEMKRAGELMIPLPSFPYIPYWFTLRQALAELEGAEGEGERGRPRPWVILVFGAENQLLGLVQRHELLAKLCPGRPTKPKNQFSLLAEQNEDFNLCRLTFSPDKAMQEINHQLSRRVLEFMRPIQATVDVNDFALLALYPMMDYNLTFVPVTQEGQIVGLISADDLLREIVSQIF